MQNVYEAICYKKKENILGHRELEGVTKAVLVIVLVELRKILS